MLKENYHMRNEIKRAQGEVARAEMTAPYVVEFDGKKFEGTDYAGELSRHLKEQNKTADVKYGSIEFFRIDKTVEDGGNVVEKENTFEVVGDLNHRAKLELVDVPGAGKRYRKYGLDQAAAAPEPTPAPSPVEDTPAEEADQGSNMDETEAVDSMESDEEEELEDFAADAVDEEEIS
jgi:hypothetical protein